MKEYWKKIEIDNIELIRKKTLDWLTNETDYLLRSKWKGPFVPLKKHRFLEVVVPEIAESFRKLDLFPDDASIYVTFNNGDSIPHKDYTDCIGRINIPILNCENSFTLFFENLKGKRAILPTGSPFYMTTNRDYHEVTRLPFDSPAIVRISEGHDILMTDFTKVPRVTLTVSTTPDAGLLLND